MASRVEQLDPSPTLLEQVTALASPETRADAAAALASSFDADALVIFVRDEEIDALLPAPGFPQTLPDGRAWREFLRCCVERGVYEGDLPLEGQGDRRPSLGFAEGQDLAFVLVGARDSTRDISFFRQLLPLLGALFRGERTTAIAMLQLRQAREEAARAATIAKTLDRARQQLEHANEQLRAQADALEGQAIEMETQADELQMSNIALAEARIVADNASQAKSEFLATMSHELRTPLNAIAGYVQLIEMGVHGPITEGQRTALGRIARSQRHLLGLINDILNLSRIESGRLAYNVADVSLSEVLADVAPMIELQLSAKSLSYEVVHREAMPIVRADREKLEQILLNLLSNAVKFTPAGGRVWVDTVRRDHTPDLVYLRVADTGVGIPREKLESIFQPFTQVDSSHSRSGGGIGLGLSISRELARGMGGDLRVRSEIGEGSVFTLTLRSAR